jgi:hypothetical protein
VVFATYALIIAGQVAQLSSSGKTTFSIFCYTRAIISNNLYMAKGRDMKKEAKKPKKEKPKA